MPAINILIANAAGSLDAVLGLVNNAAGAAAEVAGKILQVDAVDILCTADPANVIPEIGVGGYTPSRHLIYLYLDPSKDIEESEVYYTLCHELCHAKRYEGEGYGKTLFASMVFEGLAVCFEEEISNGRAFMPRYLKNAANADDLLKRAAPHFEDTGFEHYKWFIHDAGGELPRWTGYIVGYKIVKDYLELTNKKASELILEGSDTFLKFVRGTSAWAAREPARSLES